jgi:hypothetical protein
VFDTLKRDDPELSKTLTPGDFEALAEALKGKSELEGKEGVCANCGREITVGKDAILSREGDGCAWLCPECSGVEDVLRRDLNDALWKTSENAGDIPAIVGRPPLEFDKNNPCPICNANLNGWLEPTLDGEGMFKVISCPACSWRWRKEIERLTGPMQDFGVDLDGGELKPVVPGPPRVLCPMKHCREHIAGLCSAKELVLVDDANGFYCETGAAQADDEGEPERTDAWQPIPDTDIHVDHLMTPEEEAELAKGLAEQEVETIEAKPLERPCERCGKREIGWTMPEGEVCDHCRMKILERCGETWSRPVSAPDAPEGEDKAPGDKPRQEATSAAWCVCERKGTCLGCLIETDVVAKYGKAGLEKLRGIAGGEA